MLRLMQEHRRRLDDFDGINFVDTAEIEGLSAQIEVPAPRQIRSTPDYASEIAELRALYGKMQKAAAFAELGSLA